VVGRTRGAHDTGFHRYRIYSTAHSLEVITEAMSIAAIAMPAESKDHKFGGEV
jgi:hypothetical protein